MEYPITHLLDLALSRFALENDAPRSLAIIDMVSEDQPLWQMLLTSGAKRIVLQELAARAGLRGFEIAPYLRPGLPPDHCAAWTATGTFDILCWWLEQSEAAPREEVAYLLDRLTVEPALKNERRGEVHQNHR